MFNGLGRVLCHCCGSDMRIRTYEQMFDDLTTMTFSCPLCAYVSEFVITPESVATPIKKKVPA